MARARHASDEGTEPNLTPILDMVFQLITFFMLVINFKTATMDLTLRLPAIGSARPVEVKGQDLLVLNMDRNGVLRVFGAEVTGIAEYVEQEAQASLLAARKHNPNLKAGDELPAMVVIRADRKTPFRFLNTLIVSCQKNGYRTFSLKALNRPPEP